MDYIKMEIPQHKEFFSTAESLLRFLKGIKCSIKKIFTENEDTY